jgi:sucrose-6-phosphate hydrolase SacC (GH32 family)
MIRIPYPIPVKKISGTIKFSGKTEKKWVIVVALPLEKNLQFYRSQNQVNWTYMSDFGPVGDTTGICECPDLFSVPV